MAGNNFFEKAKSIVGNAGNAVVQSAQPKSIGKCIEEKMNAKSKLYGYIGMEVYDLHMAGKLDMPELAGYFEKLQVLDNEVRELQAQKQAVELQAGNRTTCICGAVLTQMDKFCPHCGARVNNGMVTCTCGNQVEKNARFCNVCGRDMQQNPVMMQPNVPPQAMNNAAVNVAPKAMKQCICGAQVPEGQFMCMECGRKIEQ